MIIFSPAKINIGLQILKKRPDGFHDLQSVMHSAGLCDILEISRLHHASQKVLFTQSGRRFEADQKDNLCLKAWDMFAGKCDLPPLEMHLHKQIPVGAGLGGGSSNASATLMGLNSLAENPLSNHQLSEMAAMLGSDCPYFLHKEPMMMEGRGEILSPVQLKLEGLYLVLLFPEIHVSTAEAYGGVRPSIPKHFLTDLIQEPLSSWKERIENDFEPSVFKTYPQLSNLKNELYREGALYASLSGSGSSLYGLFNTPPSLPEELKKHVIWAGAI